MSLLIVERTGLDLYRRYRASTGKLMSLGTMYSLLRRLREEDLVLATRRDSGARDKRVRHFKLTGEGEQAVNKGRQFYAALSRVGLDEQGALDGIG